VNPAGARQSLLDEAGVAPWCDCFRFSTLRRVTKSTPAAKGVERAIEPGPFW